MSLLGELVVDYWQLSVGSWQLMDDMDGMDSMDIMGVVAYWRRKGIFKRFSMPRQK